MVMCVIVGCTIRSDRKYDQPKRFFSIPAVIKHQGDVTKTLSTDRRILWLSRINRADLTIDHVDKIKTSKVCNRHFISGKPSALYDNTSPDWAPSLHLGHEKLKANQIESSVKRHARLCRRNKKKTTSLTFSDFVAIALDNSEHEYAASKNSEHDYSLNCEHDYSCAPLPDLPELPTLQNLPNAVVESSGKVAVATADSQTELTMKDIERLELELHFTREEVRTLKQTNATENGCVKKEVGE